MSTYSDKLKSPKWQKKRLEILQRDNFTCFNCGDTERMLHVHHESYIKGKEPWDYPDEYFRTLCDICHEHTHLLKTEFEKYAYGCFIQWSREDSKEGRLMNRRVFGSLLSSTFHEYDTLKSKKK